MDEFIKLLDVELDYVNHEIIDDTIAIHVVSNKEEVICPYSGCASSKNTMSMNVIFKIFLS